MPAQSRKHRGYRTQRIVAEWFQANGHPFAESTGAGRPGTDVTGLVGIADVEVKATARFEPLAWLRQMRARILLAQRGTEGGSEVYFGVWRPNGFGPANVADWPVITDLRTMTSLLLEAGYGDSDGQATYHPPYVPPSDPTPIVQADDDGWRQIGTVGGTPVFYMEVSNELDQEGQDDG